MHAYVCTSTMYIHNTQTLKASVTIARVVTRAALPKLVTKSY